MAIYTNPLKYKMLKISQSYVNKNQPVKYFPEKSPVLAASGPLINHQSLLINLHFTFLIDNFVRILIYQKCYLTFP